MSGEKKSKPGLFSRFKKSKEVHTATLSAAGALVGTSAASGVFLASDNSAAASRNLQNASKQLEDYLREMDDNDDRIADVISMSRYLEKLDAYSNSSFAGCAVREMNFDAPTLLLVDLAANCAKKVYRKPESGDLNPFAFEEEGSSKTITGDELGNSVKATTVGLFKGKPGLTGPDGDDIRVIVVAIRGTASIHDWMVNFNDAAQPKPAKSGFETTIADLKIADPDTTADPEFLGKAKDGTPYTTHEGFLQCAKLMTSQVSTLIEDVLKDAPATARPILVFTGHSAGGAVAALLYIHLLKSQAKDNLTSLRSRFATTHCITFGAPPITAPAITSINERAIFLAFINEGDPIPRCDREYVNSLLRLFVTPMPKVETKWPLPDPVIYNAGEIILIPRDTENDGSTIFVKPNDTGDGSLAEVVMGNPKCHKMDLYLKKLRISMVLES
ncbi:Alpha/Beta hydrolase protein [Tricladium varicosporioides]|nr:Alpha/Beta hydrolase protein [Hymenoscyphus varicosporioides]